MPVPVKRSLAVLVRRDGAILTVRRPAADDELPGIWGLPAGSFRGDESPADLIHRIGKDKLGVRLEPIRKLAEGTQTRPAYRLEMELWEASMAGTPWHPEWKWAPLEVLRDGQTKGSLCCRLAMDLL
jgi:hypothetical protein